MADFATVDQTILSRKVGLPECKVKVDPIPLKFDKPKLPKFEGMLSLAEELGDESEDDASSREESDDDEDEEEEEIEDATVSVSHVITNVIVFQSFVFELASLVQVRAGLFNEVRFV